MPDRPAVSLGAVARAWTWIGLSGFGGPPAHIALLRRLVVEREAWLDAREFEDANAACGMLPGPASTQLAIFCAYRVGGIPAALVGGLGFVVPAVVAILVLSVAFLAHSPPLWIRGAGAGAGAAVAAVAAAAARGLIGPSLARARDHAGRWAAYIVAGAVSAALIGAYLVLVLLACGAVELAVIRGRSRASTIFAWPLAAAHGAGLGSLA
ncbi:MAG TPA: chromate transporter [Solirubrobacteraceae bacterium]